MNGLPSRILVSGGAGFIGSHIVEALLKEGCHVGILDDFSTGEVSNLESDSPHLTIHRGTITDFEFVKATVGDYQAVVHEAARVSVPRSVEDPVGTNLVNVTGTLNLLVAARDSSVEKFVYASSSSVYGDTPTLPKVESMPPTPMSPYAVSKLTAESYCGVFANVYGMKTTSLRYFNVYGPRQKAGPYSGVISNFFKRLMDGEPPMIYGDGSQSRDFTFVKDAVQANMLFLSRSTTPGEYYNVGSHRRTTILQLAQLCSGIAGKPDLQPEFREWRQGDVRHSFADISKVAAAVGYEPSTSLEYGLEKVYSWMKGLRESARN